MGEFDLTNDELKIKGSHKDQIMITKGFVRASSPNGIQAQFYDGNWTLSSVEGIDFSILSDGTAAMQTTTGYRMTYDKGNLTM
jgi:hypothetical protein